MKDDGNCGTNFLKSGGSRVESAIEACRYQFGSGVDRKLGVIPGEGGRSGGIIGIIRLKNSSLAAASVNEEAGCGRFLSISDSALNGEGFEEEVGCEVLRMASVSSKHVGIGDD